MLERYTLSKEDTNEIEEFLRDLYQHYGFSSVINSQRSRDSFYAWSHDRKDDIIDDYFDSDFDICSGAARMVILYKDSIGKAKSMVESSATGYSIFLKKTQSGSSFACV